MEREIRIRTSGDRALEDARESLQEHDLTEGVVKSVDIDVVVGNKTTRTSETNDDNEREFVPVGQGTNRFELLRTVAENPGLTNAEINEIFDLADEVSPETKALYDKKLLDRNDVRPYLYEPTEYGLALLREHGVDV